MVVALGTLFEFPHDLTQLANMASDSFLDLFTLFTHFINYLSLYDLKRSKWQGAFTNRIE